MRAKPPIEVFCHTCSKSAGFKFPCHLERTKNFFCTNECKSAYQRTTKGLRAHKQVCEVCKSEYVVRPSHGLTRKTCSRKCRSELLSWRTGPEAARWKGGTWIHARGYIVEGDVMQHRRVVEQHLHRNLRDDEVVHHIDGDKKNNVIENLVVMSRSEHIKRHWREGKTYANQNS